MSPASFQLTVGEVGAGGALVGEAGTSRSSSSNGLATEAAATTPWPCRNGNKWHEWLARPFFLSNTELCINSWQDYNLWLLDQLANLENHQKEKNDLSVRDKEEAHT